MNLQATYIPVLVISLLGSARRQPITRRLKALGVDFTFIDAVDGKTLTDEALTTLANQERSVRRIGRSLIRNEIGCALSHRKAYKHIVDAGWPAAVILEDDVIPTPDFFRFIREINWMPAQISLLSLYSGSGIICRRPRFREGDYGFYRAAGAIEGACGYIIRKSFAQYLISITVRISTVADWPFDLRNQNHYVMIPNIINHDFTVPSEVGKDRPSFIAPPPPIIRKFAGLRALSLLPFLRHPNIYDGFYNYYERELRVRIKARLPWLYQILNAHNRLL